MAVPKKRTPKSRRNARRSGWFQKALKKGNQALAFAKNWISKKEKADIDLEKKISLSDSE